MGERINPTNLSDGVFKRGEMVPGKNDSATYYTRQLVPGERFNHPDELVAIQDNVEYRVMNPVLSKLAASICSKIDNIFVRSGSNVLYLAGADDASSVFTISYISDIVGKDGIVFVAGKSEVVQGVNGFRRLDIRSNVQFIAVDNNTNYEDSAVACKNLIENLGKRIDVLFCDVGHRDQLDCLITNVSVIMKNESNFVAFLKAHQTVHVNFAHNLAVVPDISIFLAFRERLEECGLFQHLSGVTLQFYTGWCCAVGSINC